jgi:acetyl esterase/lipase
MKSLIISVSLLFIGIIAISQNNDSIKKELNIPYYSSSVNQSDKYIKDKCILDIYYPRGIKGFPTIVWFHGGGLTGGDKALPPGLVQTKVCIISVGYRLYPNVKCPEYLKDAAAAVSWVFNNIKQYGGDPGLIFISGHSAGAYLTSMIGLDKKWLAANNIDANKIAGLFPLSGNGITHQAIRDERGISNMVPVVDEYAPLFHVRADAPPLILMTGDREMEYIGRYEENAYLLRMMKLVGHKETILYEFDGYGHAMTLPAFPLLFKHVTLITEKLKKMKKN